MMNDNSYSTPLASLGKVRCSRKIRGFNGGYGEIIGRAFRVVLPFMIFIFLAVSLGSNNSSGGKSLPDVTNCTSDVYPVNIDSIRTSTNTFNGIFIVVSLIAVFVEAPLFVLKSLDSHLLEEHWKFFWIFELIVSQLFTHAFAGGIIGSYVLTWLWSPYYSAVSQDHKSSTLKSASVVLGMTWTLYGFFIGSYMSFFVSYTGIISYGVRKQYGLGCGRCDYCKSLNPTANAPNYDVK